MKFNRSTSHGNLARLDAGFFLGPQGPVCVVGGVRVPCRQMDAPAVGLVAAIALSGAATLIPYREMKTIGGVCLLLILLATLSQAIELVLR